MIEGASRILMTAAISERQHTQPLRPTHIPSRHKLRRPQGFDQIVPLAAVGRYPLPSLGVLSDSTLAPRLSQLAQSRTQGEYVLRVAVHVFARGDHRFCSHSAAQNGVRARLLDQFYPQGERDQRVFARTSRVASSFGSLQF